MKTAFPIKILFGSALVAAAVHLSGCYSDSEDGTRKINSQLKGFREELQREDEITSKEMEADLDDELNPVEQREVHKVFENNLKSRRRAVNDVFGDLPEQK